YPHHAAGSRTESRWRSVALARIGSPVLSKQDALVRFSTRVESIACLPITVGRGRPPQQWLQGVDGQAQRSQAQPVAMKVKRFVDRRGKVCSARVGRVNPR